MNTIILSPCRMCGIALCLALGASAYSMPEFPDDHPAVRLYLSPDAWQERIREAKRSQREEFEAVRADFDLAIRSAFILEKERPRLAEESLYYRKKGPDPKPNRVLFGRRDILLSVMDEWTNKEGGTELIAWYQSHLDELTVDDSPMLHVVLADSILNDCSDWSKWEAVEVLDALRQECPQPHRRFAWDLAMGYSISEYNGIAMRTLVDREPPSCFDLRKASHLVAGFGNAQVLDFLIQAYGLSLSADRHTLLIGALNSIDPKADEDQTKAFRDTWARQLASSDPVLRSIAVTRTGEMVRRIRTFSRGMDNSEEVQARLQQQADTDSDSEVRRRAKEILESIRTAEWRDDP